MGSISFGGLVIQFLSPAGQTGVLEELLDDAADLKHAKECRCRGCQRVLVSTTTDREKLLERADRFRFNHPAAAFRGLMEDWTLQQLEAAGF